MDNPSEPICSLSLSKGVIPLVSKARDVGHGDPVGRKERPSQGRGKFTRRAERSALLLSLGWRTAGAAAAPRTIIPYVSITLICKKKKQMHSNERKPGVMFLMRMLPSYHDQLGEKLL